MIEVRVVADSTFHERRILTLSCDYPRFIHPQVMTYGMIRKSTSSSRAIPVKRQLDLADEHAFIPTRFSKNQPGMGATENLDDVSYGHAKALIESHLNFTRAIVEKLAGLGVHKQHANRYLEPYLITKCTMTGAVEAFQHLIRQRCHGNAHVEVQPEMFELAQKIEAAIEKSEPTETRRHVPYFSGERPSYNDALYAIARAARDSYQRNDVSPEFMGKLEKLWDEGHLGPFEHVAYFDTSGCFAGPLTLPYALSGGTDEVMPEDLYGWRTARHLGLKNLKELF